MGRYKLGYYYELKTKRLLEKEGYDVWRSPASKSPVDLIAIKANGDNVLIKLIQVKASRNGSVDKYDIEELKEFAKKYAKFDNVSVELWIYNKNNRNLEKINIKELIS